MEARKITIVSTKTQTKKVIMSEAETLGALKADLDAAGIDYEDMTFYEGTSKTELKLNDAILPKDVPYTNRTTGETVITNELVFMLTNTNKKIKSGVLNANRKAAYDAIKANHLEDMIKTTFGKNFTQCSTAELETFLKTQEEEVLCNCPSCNCVDENARRSIRALINRLYQLDVIYDYSEVEDILSPININGETKGLSSSYDDEEIDQMFENLL